MIRVRISEEAVHDLNDGFRFYEAQEPGVGDHFLACLRSDVEGLRITGGSHRLVFQDYRRALSRTFPHAIYYTCEDDELVVWAVVDCRRDPGWIREHLDP